MLVAVDVPAAEPVGVKVGGPAPQPVGIGGVRVDGGGAAEGGSPGGELVVQAHGGAVVGAGLVVGPQVVDVAAGGLLRVQAVGVVHHLWGKK